MKHRVRKAVVAVALAGVTTALLLSAQGAAASKRPERDRTPYMGWTSWSVQALRNDEANPRGNYSWLSEENVVAQIDYIAEHLRPYGYDLINIDAGWWREWDWTPRYDEYGRPAVWGPRFPHGMKWLIKYARKKGLKVGIYMPAGIEHGREGTNPGLDFASTPIYKGRGCVLEDAVYPDHRNGTRFNSGYLLDFDNGTGCARKYIESIVALFESWGGVEHLKIDGWSDINLRELQEYRRAFDATGRHVHLQISWSIPRSTVDQYSPYADSWRTGFDVECRFLSPCTTYTRWNEINARFQSIIDWQGVDGPETGFNNLDTLLVGSGTLGGLTDTERQTTMSLWSIANAPLYIGEDARHIDEYGLSLLTNRDVIAVNQDRLGAGARLVSRSGTTWYVFAKPLANGDVAVGLFNAGSTPATISTTAADAGLESRSGKYLVRDLWTKRNQVTDGTVTATLPAHGSAIFRISKGRPDCRGRCGRGR